MYIKYLCDVASKSDSNVIFKLFADDAKFYIYLLNNVDMMQRCLDSVLQLDLTWQLKFCVSKFNVLVIGNATFSCEY